MSRFVDRRVRRSGAPRAAATAVAALLLLAAALPLSAQNGPTINANWPLADRFSADAMRAVLGTQSVSPRWIAETDSMWYSFKDRTGTRFMFVVPKSETQRPLFDHVQFAAELSTLHRKPFDANALPMTTLDFDSLGRSFTFMVDSVRYSYTLESRALNRLGVPTREERAAERARSGNGPRDFRNYSPDSTAFVFAREHNLYLVEVNAADTLQSDTTQLTTDGERWYSFGARDTTQQNNNDNDDDDDDDEDSDAQARANDDRVRANVTWSPDSRAFYVTRNDSRKVEELYLVNVLAEPRPRLVSYKYAMPGEENVAQVELFTHHRGMPALSPINVAKWKDQRLFNIHWTTGSDRLRLVRRDRPQRKLEMIEVDLPTGGITSLLTEEVDFGYLERQNVRYFREGGDFLWWSERTGWGHMYLYAHDGTLKRQLTSGPWRVDAIVDTDSTKRNVWFRGVGRETGENPYYAHLYRLNVDGGGPVLLDAGNASNSSILSPSKKFVVNNASRVDLPTTSVLRDERGNVHMQLEAMDMSGLDELGWRAPEHFTVKAADGITDIFGTMWKPFDFDPNRKYPIVAHVYPGPQTETVTTSFSPNNVNQRLAQLGFIVVQIGNRGGSPTRSNAYHSFGYFNLRDYGLADKKTGIEQLAIRHPFIDIDRVGIYGHSGGGFMTAAALMQEPYNDFFKVGVSSAGNHDNNVYNQNWSEQHHGLREVRAEREAAEAEADLKGLGSADVVIEDDTRFEIKVPANHELAANLKGRLLLVHGDMDNNVHPAGTIRLANALIKANKRFDFFIMPGKRHGYGDMQDYYTRMMFEYFSEHLLGDYYRSSAEIR